MPTVLAPYSKFLAAVLTAVVAAVAVLFGVDSKTAVVVGLLVAPFAVLLAPANA